jgi:hypothetical protein
MVDNESCTPVTYEGYVQACCEDGASLQGRVPFSITFTPNPTCRSYNITCNSGSVTEIGIVNPGAGYDPTPGATIITIDPPSGPGVQATADPVIVGNAIVGIVINNPGSGYTTVPNVTISCNPALPCPPFGGYAAQLQAVVKCASITEPGTDCSESIPTGLLLPNTPILGQNWNSCFSNGVLPSLPAGYSIVDQGCCANCVNMSVTVLPGGPSVPIRFTRCSDKKVIVGTVLAGTTSNTVCMVAGSLLVLQPDPLNPSATINIGAAC